MNEKTEAAVGEASRKLDREAGKRLVMLLTVAYFVSYITRKNYSVAMVQIIKDLAITKSAASKVLTANAIAYGAGQLLSGYLGDKIRPRYIIFAGLITTALMNFAMPFCPGIGSMTVVWCINGLAQAMMWPPIVKIMTQALSREDYTKATATVSIGSSSGTMAVYLAVPFFLTFASWRTVFGVCGACAVIMAAILFAKCPDVGLGEKSESPRKASPDEKQKAPAKIAEAFPIVIFIGILLAIIVQGLLRDGITDWMPTYISETFRMDSSSSILSSVALPIFSIFCFKITTFLQLKVFKNELACAGTFFVTALVCALILTYFSSASVILSVLLSTVITGCMHGVNVLLICVVPAQFTKYGRVSLISGVLNSCTYIGSATSAYLFSSLSEGSGGWKAVIISWAVLSLVGLVICTLFSKRWKKFVG